MWSSAATGAKVCCALTYSLLVLEAAKAGCGSSGQGSWLALMKANRLFRRIGRF